MSLDTTSVFHPPCVAPLRVPPKGGREEGLRRGFSQADMRGAERGAAPAFFTLPAGEVGRA